MSLPAAVFVILFETARPRSTLAHRGARSQAAFATSMTCVQTLWKRPASGAVWHALIVPIKQHVDRITGCICYMRDLGFEVMEAEPAAEEKWVTHVNEVEQKARTGRRFEEKLSRSRHCHCGRNPEPQCRAGLLRRLRASQ
jgi:hypothetical protein